MITARRRLQLHVIGVERLGYLTEGETVFIFLGEQQLGVSRGGALMKIRNDIRIERIIFDGSFKHQIDRGPREVKNIPDVFDDRGSEETHEGTRTPSDPALEGQGTESPNLSASISKERAVCSSIGI